MESNRGMEPKASWERREKDVAASPSQQLCFDGGIMSAAVQCCYHGEVNISAKFLPSPRRCCVP